MADYYADLLFLKTVPEVIGVAKSKSSAAIQWLDLQ
jgi:hypothetical protein